MSQGKETTMSNHNERREVWNLYYSKCSAVYIDWRMKVVPVNYYVKCLTLVCTCPWCNLGHVQYQWQEMLRSPWTPTDEADRYRVDEMIERKRRVTQQPIANKNFVSHEKVKARIVISDIENWVCYELLELAPRNGNGSWWAFADKCYCDMNLKANEEFSLQNFHWGRKLGA